MKEVELMPAFQLIIKKSPKPIVYLDSNVIIELKRSSDGLCSSKYSEQIGHVLCFLQDCIARGVIICPIGNQLEEVGLSETKQSAKNFLLSFTNDEMHSPYDIQQSQTGLFYESYLTKKKTIEISYQQSIKDKVIVGSRFRVHVTFTSSERTLEKIRQSKENSTNYLNELKRSKKTGSTFIEQLEAELACEHEFVIRAL